MIVPPAAAAASDSSACNLCASDDGEVLSLVDRSGGYLRTTVCRRCGLVFTNPRPGPGELRAWYAARYRVEYKGTRTPTRRQLYRAARGAVARYRVARPLLDRPPRRVLEIGSGAGELVFLLRRLGHEASGVEPDLGFARWAREELGLPIHEGVVEELELPAGSLDLVLAFHVLEHLGDPLQALRRAAGWLRPGGQALIEVPDVEAVCQAPRQRFHRAHLHSFNATTLAATGARAGLALAELTRSEDGGNLTARFVRDAAAAAALPLPGDDNYRRVAAIVRGHTAARHFLTLTPYRRLWRKLGRQLRERRDLAAGASGRELLEAAVRTVMQEG